MAPAQRLGAELRVRLAFYVREEGVRRRAPVADALGFEYGSGAADTLGSEYGSGSGAYERAAQSCSGSTTKQRRRRVVALRDRELELTVV